MTISKDSLGLAAEYAVASELCRRGIYAQLTLGNRKRTDLLVDADLGTMLRVQVKAKQGREWPGVKGVYGKSIVLVLVDYEKKELSQKPDFYILTPKDWATVIKNTLIKTGHAARGDVKISADNVPTWKDNWVGLSVRPEHLRRYRDAWEKVAKLVAVPANRAVHTDARKSGARE